VAPFVNLGEEDPQQLSQLLAEILVPAMEEDTRLSIEAGDIGWRQKGAALLPDFQEAEEATLDLIISGQFQEDFPYLLYDVQAELEKAYDGYIEEEKPLQFNSYMINQDIAPTASNETMMYFLTSVLLPIDSNHGYAHRIGAGFDKKTGEHINNWKLFSCSPEEAKQEILDIANINDPILRKEMEIAFKAENIILFPENLEISFKKGTLPSQENSYILGLDYDERLSKILNDWAIPKTSE